MIFYKETSDQETNFSANETMSSCILGRLAFGSSNGTSLFAIPCGVRVYIFQDAVYILNEQLIYNMVSLRVRIYASGNQGVGVGVAVLSITPGI